MQNNIDTKTQPTRHPHADMIIKWHNDTSKVGRYYNEDVHDD